MENTEINNVGVVSDGEKVEINKLSLSKFILLSVITFGLYEIWWIYKSWCFFRDKEKMDINPALRTLLSIFFLIPLFNKIIKLAVRNGYNKNYSSTLLFICYFILSLLGNLPKPFFLVAIFSFIFIIPPFLAFNYAIDFSDEYKVIEQKTFNGRQIFLLTFGGIFWVLVIIGLFM